MDIKSVNTQKQILQSDKVEKKKISREEEAKAQSSEIIEDTFESTPDLLELKPVMDKLRSGFYDKPEVIKQLANILDEKFPPEKIKEL